MEKEKISIIIPVFKVEKYLQECLDSLLNQTYKNLVADVLAATAFLADILTLLH